jgi:hypothetical protein
MRADDRHCVANGGRLELGDGVLDGAGKVRGEQRDDEHYADARRRDIVRGEQEGIETPLPGRSSERVGSKR